MSKLCLLEKRGITSGRHRPITGILVTLAGRLGYRIRAAAKRLKALCASVIVFAK
jgi:hypothetical protein